MIDVVLLGSGATMPTPRRGVSAAVLQCGGRSILFDCGEGTQTALRREKLSPVKIDLIALTHYHGDHIFGLPGLLQTMDCLKREDALTITGPDGLAMRSLHRKWPAGARLQRIPTEHRVPSQGYSFRLSRPAAFLPDKARAFGIPVPLWKQILAEDPTVPIQVNGKALEAEGRLVCGADVLGEVRKGLHVVFSGDTAVCDAMRRYARGADLLIHDATYGEDAQEEEAARWGHSTFRQAALLAKEAGVKCLWLTHFSQAMVSPEDSLMNARHVFENAVCGYDGLSIHLKYVDS